MQYRHKVPPLALLALGLSTPAPAAVITEELRTELEARNPQEPVPVIIGFADRIDPDQYRGKGRRERSDALVRALRDKADRTQGPVIEELRRRGALKLRQLWINNSLAAEVPAKLIPAIERMPGIESLRYDAVVEAPVATQGTTAVPQWNIDAIGAPRLWALGYDGTGTVVANLDTGVDGGHPDLQAAWRGAANSWYDAYGQHTTPYDALGHGTQTMGLLVGGSAGGSAIGVAPGARWIAAKVFDDAGKATYSALHLGFQWALDPDGDAATPDAPDVVNNSWGLTAAGNCSLEFNTDIQMLRAAGINVTFAGGNYGPDPATSISPANNGGGFGVGAVDAAEQVTPISSRGPSACDGSYFPKLAAPGANVKTATLSLGGALRYATVSGTSFAAPHVAGALALLVQAFPEAPVEALETALKNTARDMGTVGADNGYGYGIVDVAAAYDALKAAPPVPPVNRYPVANDDGAATRANQMVVIPVTANDKDSDGSIDQASVTIIARPKKGSAVARSDGSVAYVPKPNFRGTDTFGYTVRDDMGAESNRATVTVTVVR